nr:hypothetical protein [Tanacetum cinerariifolium]
MVKVGLIYLAAAAATKLSPISYLLVGETRDKGGVGSDSVMYPSDSAVGDTAAGSGCSSTRSISSAGGRYSGYSGPGM